MISFHSVTLTVPESSSSVAVVTCPGPNFVWTSLGCSMFVILPATFTARMPGFSSAIFMFLYSPFTTSPVAKLLPTAVILTFTLSPAFVPGTKTTKLFIRAMPSPLFPTDSTVTSTPDLPQLVLDLCRARNGDRLRHSPRHHPGLLSCHTRARRNSSPASARLRLHPPIAILSSFHELGQFGWILETQCRAMCLITHAEPFPSFSGASSNLPCETHCLA